jgi:hypothetical protein
MSKFVGSYVTQVNMDCVRKVEIDDNSVRVTYCNGDIDTFDVESALNVVKEIRDAVKK